MISSILIFYKNSSLLKICSKILQIWFKIVRQIKIHKKLPKNVLCFFSIWIFFRISTKFSQNFNQKLKNTLNGMAFDNSFLSFRNVLYFSNIRFFPLSFSFKMRSEKWPQWIWMTFPKGLCSYHSFMSRMKPFYLPIRDKKFHFKNC